MGKSYIDVFERIEVNERPSKHLYVEAVYKAKTNANISGDVLAKIFHGIHNLGGFRYPGEIGSLPPFLVLFSSGEHLEWRDSALLENGVFSYYGDNKKSGNDFLKTSLGGNSILEQIFEKACSDRIEERKQIPPIFIFRKEIGRNVQFLGLGVPGVKGIPANEWLTAEWRTNKDGERYLNYRASFNLLNTASGCKAEPRQSGISLQWLTDIENGDAFNSPFAPYEWKKYIRGNSYAVLSTQKECCSKSKEDQLPSANNEKRILDTIYHYFYDYDNGYSFEPFANYFVKLFDPSHVIEVTTTPPYRDGGVDGIGEYEVFKNAMETVKVKFYVQAKCYDPTGSHAVGVTDMARLISRIKNRQFGIMVTTSYINKQAYEEVLDDGHPIVFITGKTIVETMCRKMNIHSPGEMSLWLRDNFPLPESRE